MNAEKQFKKWWDKQDAGFKERNNIFAIKITFLDAISVCRKLERESITNNSFGQNHYQRGYKDGWEARLKDVIKIIKSIPLEQDQDGDD